MHTHGMRWRSKLAAACLLAGMAGVAVAQRGGGGPGGGGPGGGGPGGGGPGGGGYPSGPGGGFDRGAPPPPPSTNTRPEGTASTRNGLQLGPAARWWDDKKFAKDLKLRPEQVTRMDAVFDANRPALVQSLQNLQQEQQRLETLTQAEAPDEKALDAQIERVTQARAELEKANTHVLLELHKEMDADQLARLEKHK